LFRLRLFDDRAARLRLRFLRVVSGGGSHKETDTRLSCLLRQVVAGVKEGLAWNEGA
jgi:hypothetical protein